ncbi:MAG TPA: rod shape-determining protein MreC [Solirubrobacteraceae bacterium]|nr:rod shape-determining protein MreC [Solirubrobacteraceae bacterium]
MYDRKTVRRRRAVLGLLVACSLIFLTAYFGEGSGGGLHSIQRGFAEVLSPFERVGSGALKPVRDFSGWVGDTFHAKKDNRAIRKELDRTRAENLKLKDQLAANAAAAKLVGLDQSAGLDPTKQVTAHVVLRSSPLWYSTVNIDKGTSAGVARNDAVVNSAGLVGRVTEVWSNGAKVTLITDRASGVTARDVDAKSRPSGTVETGAPGNPNDLLLTGLQLDDPIAVGDSIETAGIESATVPGSYYPRGIAIGVVTKADPDELQTSQQVHIRPYAKLRDLEVVQVITDRSSS